MPRITRNSRDADFAVPPSSGSAPVAGNTLSADERREIVQEVVQASCSEVALLANASVQRAVTSDECQQPNEVSAESTTQGMSDFTTLPTFVNTFALSGAAGSSEAYLSGSLPNADVTSVPPHPTMALPALPTMMPQEGPPLHQPFVLIPGCSPVSPKLVSNICNGKFVELGDLLSPEAIELDDDPHDFFEGRLVLTASPRRSRRQITDILSWLEAFTIFGIVLTSYFPQRWRDLSLYKLFIVRTYRQFAGTASQKYDKAFREHAAATGLVDWSGINTQLYSVHMAGSLPRSRTSEPQTASAYRANDASPYRSSFCRSWNSGMCSMDSGHCRYPHKCLLCVGNHPVVDCPKKATASPSGNERWQDRPPNPSNAGPSNRR